MSFVCSLNIRHNDILTLFDGHDLTSHVIGQYLGSRERFRVVSGGSEVTIQFQSDPDDSTFILSQGFLIHYRGKRQRACPFSVSFVLQLTVMSLPFVSCRGGAKWHMSCPSTNWVWLEQLFPSISGERQCVNLSVSAWLWHCWVWHHHLPVGSLLEQQPTHMCEKWAELCLSLEHTNVFNGSLWLVDSSFTGLIIWLILYTLSFSFWFWCPSSPAVSWSRRSGQWSALSTSGVRFRCGNSGTLHM